MRDHGIGLTIMIVVLLVAATARSERPAYTYEVTVGEGTGYDYEYINDAISYIKARSNPSLGPGVYGCIRLYEKEYEENLNDHYYPEGQNLPAYCDLIGMELDISKVKIKHQGAFGENSWAGVTGNGNNIVANLTVEDIGSSGQDSVRLGDDSELANCHIDSDHAAVSGTGDLAVSDCTVTSLMGACINVEGDCAIARCALYPRVRSHDMELPGGLRLSGSGSVDTVTITASGASSYQFAGGGLVGIHLWLDAGEEVFISDVDIDLQLTSKYHATETGTLRVCGILSGSYWSCPWGDVNKPGKAVVRDCTIDVTGIEEDGTGENDGADIMVDGVCVRGGGTLEVYGCSSITTSWTSVGDLGEGHEYLLNDDNDTDYCGTGGTIGASFPGIQFDPTGDQYFYPSKGAIDKLWGIGFRLEDDSGDAVAVFDYCGNLLLYGSLTDEQTWPSATMDDEFIVEDSTGNNLAVISAVDGDMFIHGEVKRESANEWDDPDAGEDEFIIYEKEGHPVAYIDESGNVYLKGGLFEQWHP